MEVERFGERENENWSSRDKFIVILIISSEAPLFINTINVSMWLEKSQKILFWV